MLIKGLQKLTLLDFPGKTACTIFLAGCNFRCPFCHNASLVTHIDDGEYSREEIFAFLKKRRAVLEGVCVTGGEPTLNADLGDFLKEIKDLGYAVKLDTNGYNPEMLKKLVEERLVDYVAMDIKNSQAAYGKTVGRDNFDVLPVLQSVAFLEKGQVDYEFRTTLVEELHTEKTIDEMGKWLSGAKVLYLQRFADSGDLINANFTAPTVETMKKYQKILSAYVENVYLRGVE